MFAQRVLSLIPCLVVAVVAFPSTEMPTSTAPTTTFNESFMGNDTLFEIIEPEFGMNETTEFGNVTDDGFEIDGIDMVIVEYEPFNETDEKPMQQHELGNFYRYVIVTELIFLFLDEYHDMSGMLPRGGKSTSPPSTSTQRGHVVKKRSVTSESPNVTESSTAGLSSSTQVPDFGLNLPKSKLCRISC